MRPWRIPPTPTSTIQRVSIPDSPGDPSSRPRRAISNGPSFASASGGGPAPDDPREHVLVVDDESSIRLSLHRYFSRQGYRVSIARNGCEALTIMDETGSVGVVVTDLVMPDYDGRRLITDMRARHPDVGVVVISGFPAALLPEPGPDGHTVPFLPKPFSLDALGNEVRRLFDDRTRRRASA
jgi:DNA-binding NtrC family response regulator